MDEDAELVVVERLGRLVAVERGGAGRVVPSRHLVAPEAVGDLRVVQRLVPGGEFVEVASQARPDRAHRSHRQRDGCPDAADAAAVGVERGLARGGDPGQVHPPCGRERELEGVVSDAVLGESDFAGAGLAELQGPVFRAQQHLLAGIGGEVDPRGDGPGLCHVDAAEADTVTGVVEAERLALHAISDDRRIVDDVARARQVACSVLGEDRVARAPGRRPPIGVVGLVEGPAMRRLAVIRTLRRLGRCHAGRLAERFERAVNAAR